MDLRGGDDRSRALLAAFPDPLLLLDREGVCIDYHARDALALFVPPEALLGRRLCDVLAPEAAAAWARALDAALRSGGPEPAECVVDREGMPCYVEARFVACGADQALVIVRDVTDRRQAQDEIQRQRDALHQSEKLAAMGELLAGVAHELNNPLSVLIGQASLLRRAAAAGALAERAEKIEQASDRCARIVRNFLALAGQHRPERKRVKPNVLVRDAVELLAHYLRVDGVTLELELSERLPELWADPHQLQQVLVNIITNAQQAMRGQAPPRRIRLATRAASGSDGVLLEIEDSGPGIPAELRERVFDAFFTTKPAGQGTGLGLSLCRSLVADHDGQICVESGSAGGALFRLELPAAARSAPRETTKLTVAPTGRSILVVDDEASVRELLTELLAVDLHHVDTVPDGAAALGKLGERAYDLILCDMKTPELDGPGLYRELERKAPALTRRLVFMTGDVLNPSTREFLDRAAAATLSKPFNLQEVRHVVWTALRAADAPSQ